MKRQEKKRLWAWALALALTVLNPQTAGAMTLNTSKPEPGQGSAERAYEVSLDTVTVGAGERYDYLTVDPSFSGDPLAQDYCPGELTVELTGPVTVAAGGVLSIGKLAVGGSEPSPVLRGELSPEGLIRVEAGGVLWLNGVTPELSGSGLAIVQEPGAVVEIYDTPLEEELCRWGGAVADNRYAIGVETALAQGDPLTAERLPSEGRVWLNERGRSEYLRLPMEWDVTPCQGQTGGEAAVFGTYLGMDGQPIPALLPVEARVRWYTPEEIVLTEKSWLGNTAATARLGYRPLPKAATEIWGELSRDGGKSWERWESCGFDESDGHLTCTFSLSDAVPRQYRLTATDEEGSRFWRSEAVLLPKEETDDQGGNRGGSTDPVPPSREPAPVEEDDGPEEDWEPGPASEPAAAETAFPLPTPEPTQARLPGPEPTPGPVSTETFDRPPEPEITPPSAAEELAVLEVTFSPEPPPPLAPEPVPLSMPAPEAAAPVAEPLPTEGPSQPPAGAVPAAVRESASPRKPGPGASPAPRKRAEGPTPTAAPVSVAAMAPAEGAEAPRALSPALQAGLVLAGLGACALVGVSVAHGGLFRKKK